MADEIEAQPGEGAAEGYPIGEAPVLVQDADRFADLSETLLEDLSLAELDIPTRVAVATAFGQLARLRMDRYLAQVGEGLVDQLDSIRAVFEESAAAMSEAEGDDPVGS